VGRRFTADRVGITDNWALYEGIILVYNKMTNIDKKMYLFDLHYNFHVGNFTRLLNLSVVKLHLSAYYVSKCRCSDLCDDHLCSHRVIMILLSVLYVIIIHGITSFVR